jgi:TolA-binding protein
MTPRPTRLSAVLLATTLVSGVHASARAQDLTSASRELTEVEQLTNQLRAPALRGSELRSPTYVEERLTDGELFYRLKDYVRASVILIDIVENFPKHPSYPDALFLLGESLFHASDYLGARARYRTIIEHADVAAYRPHVQASLGRLIEIAIKTRNFDGVDNYFERLARLPPSEIAGATAYFRAKYLYSVAVPADITSAPEGPLPQVDPQKLEQARLAFDAVPEASPYALQARYFSGVIYTLRGQYNPAIDAFKRVAQAKVQNDAQRDVAELAQLSLGRLYYETDQVERSIEAYQSIPRTSKRFETALYEIAWTYIRQGDSTRAERALEVLSVAAPESQYIPDAKILRGNLLLRDGRYTLAAGVFTDVTKEFQPVRDELDKILAQQPDQQAYFRELVRTSLEQFDDQAFLPPLALRWARIEGDMRRAVETVGDLSQARHMTRETGVIVERLTSALQAPNRVNIFPDLRDQRERSVALRNRLERVRQQLIAADEAQSQQYNSAELSEVRARRRDLDRSLAALPVKESDFQRRNNETDSRFVVLDKELSALEVQLLGMDARIVATDRFMTDSMGSETMRTGVEAYRTELTTQRHALADYREQLARLHQELEASRLQVGVGDSIYVRDDNLRTEHAQMVERERQLVASLGGRSAQTDTLYRRASAVETALDSRDKQVDQVVDERSRDMQRVLTEEGGKLDGYRQQLVALDGQTEDVVGGLSYANYRQVQQRFYDLVLKADVGVVDVGWAEREEHRTRIEMLTRERARALQSLDDEFREIMDERGTP